MTKDKLETIIEACINYNCLFDGEMNPDKKFGFSVEDLGNGFKVSYSYITELVNSSEDDPIYSKDEDIYMDNYFKSYNHERKEKLYSYINDMISEVNNSELI